MSSGFYIAFTISVFVIITVLKGVRQVPQGFKWVVQRLGKYQTSLNPGLNFIIILFTILERAEEVEKIFFFNIMI